MASRLALSSFVAAPRSLAAFVLHRCESTTANVARKDPAEAAQSLINKLPGDSIAAKTGFFTVAATLGATVISKEFYVINAETFEAFAHIGAFYIWYAASKDAVKEHFAEKRSRFVNVLNAAREDHKAVVSERIEHIKQMGDVVDVTTAMYGMSKEISRLEAEIYALRQETAFNQDVKATLDGWVRYEASVREREQKELVRNLLERVEKKIHDPKFQDAYLHECLDGVEKVGRSI